MMGHASPPADLQQTDTYFVVAHIHYVLFGGAMMGIFSGIYYWFPKMTGRMLSKTLGLWHFWVMLIGFNLAFFPMHLLGLKGMPRRIADYPASAGWTFLNRISTVGAFMIAAALTVFLVNVVTSLRKPRTATDDPWNANSLEWATSSPPPVHNFDRLPPIRSNRPVYDLRAATAAVAPAAGNPSPATGGEAG